MKNSRKELSTLGARLGLSPRDRQVILKKVESTKKRDSGVGDISDLLR